MKAVMILPAVLMLFSISHSSVLVDDVIDILMLGNEVITSIAETWDLVEQMTSAFEDLHSVKRREQKILKKLDEVSKEIQISERTIMNTAYLKFQEITQRIQGNSRLDNLLYKLLHSINQINVQNSKMQSYAKKMNNIEKVTLERFAKLTVSDSSDSVQGQLENIHFIVIGSSDIHLLGRPGAFDFIDEHLKQQKSTACTFGMSAQQVLYQLYNAISIIELKGYSLMQFSWMLLKTYGEGNFTIEAELMRERFEMRIKQTQSILQKVLERADRDVWRCDPNNGRHVEGETFLQLTRLLQGYIENEVDMNTDNTCRENCAHYSYGVKQETCYKELYCAKQDKCNGKMYECKFVDSDMWVCPAATGSDRRYEYIEYEDGKVLGKKGYCARGTTKVDSWWRWLFWHCSYCFCLCDDAGPRSDRYINMREAVSDVANNKVVTGVRFIKKNRIIHLQIQQGELLARGNINNRTLEWVAPSNYQLLQNNIKNGVDYHTFSWNNRAIDLDNLMAPASHVVTGVRFRKIGQHLNMEMRFTKIDFVSGKLIDSSINSWYGKDNTDNSEENKRAEVTTENLDVSTRARVMSIPKSEDNQFIKFEPTDYDKDAAQTTIPFFDAQPCVSSTPTPLAGIGLFYKGAESFGGFIAPKIFSYDLGSHL